MERYRLGRQGLYKVRPGGKCQNQDLPDFGIFRMFTNPENPPILVILILTMTLHRPCLVGARPNSPGISHTNSSTTSPFTRVYGLSIPVIPEQTEICKAPGYRPGQVAPLPAHARLTTLPSVSTSTPSDLGLSSPSAFLATTA